MLCNMQKDDLEVDNIIKIYNCIFMEFRFLF